MEAIDLAIIFIRTVILYFAILISMRVMGKRQLGELEISEFIVAALIADLAATPLQEIGIPLLNGLLPILIMFCLEIIIAGLNMKSIKLRKLTYGNYPKRPHRPRQHAAKPFHGRRTHAGVACTGAKRRKQDSLRRS